ncbi:MAG TPA: DUF5985 family protein [Longimicrobiaceae bacterium]|nr:DUF5985 family protein [Longimicrobiaceae bacterium]
MTGLVAGALAMGYFVAALFFLKFWRDARDRLFLLFAVAFGLLMLQRVALALVGDAPEASLPLYGLRLLAFLVIIVAIVDKNRAGRD